MQISDELMVIAWDMARSSSPLQRQMHADYLKAGIEAALSLPVQPVAWRDIDTPQGQERDAFKAGWWTNADYNQPASYLEQCEEVDWREYQKTGLDYYVSALIQAARNNADDEASSIQVPLPTSTQDMADWSDLPKDIYVVAAKSHGGIAFDVTCCSVPMVTAPEVRYTRADLVATPVKPAYWIVTWPGKDQGVHAAYRDIEEAERAAKNIANYSTKKTETTIVPLYAAPTSPPVPLPSEDGSERFLLAYVSQDTKIIGIEHPTEADWAEVLAAHVALRDRLNVRIAEQEKCPFNPSAPSVQP